MEAQRRTLGEVNAMPNADFVAAFGDVAEHSSWVAERAAQRRPFASRAAMIEAFAAAVRSASREEALALIRAHPDLATRARLTTDSSREQKGAGLDTLNQAEFDHFIALNAGYRERFGFPFILAVKGATKHQILASFEKRIHHSPEVELESAIANVCRIIRFRIEEKVAP
jgi:2-oxo-4-hydroxy-4-carboxy-5-ureidoimidazoline decarboxylase